MRVIFKIGFLDPMCPWKPYRWKRGQTSENLMHLYLFLPTLPSWYLFLSITSWCLKSKALCNMLVHLLKGKTSSTLSSQLVLIPRLLRIMFIYSLGIEVKKKWCSDSVYRLEVTIDSHSSLCFFQHQFRDSLL